MHDSLVGISSCKQRVSAGRSGGQSAAASHGGKSRVGRKEKRQSEWTELSCLICVYVIIGYGNEEQCYHSHQHLQVGRGPTVWERTILSVEFHAK